MADDKIMIDDELDALTPGQHLVIMFRACKRAGVWAEWQEGGTLDVADDLDPDDETFIEAWSHEARLFVATQMTSRLEADGLIYRTGINEHGEIMYAAVPDPEKLAAAIRRVEAKGNSEGGSSR